MIRFALSLRSLVKIKIIILCIYTIAAQLVVLPKKKISDSGLPNLDHSPVELEPDCSGRGVPAVTAIRWPFILTCKY